MDAKSDGGLNTTATPNWVLAVGPFLVIGLLIAITFATLQYLEFDWLSMTGTINVLIVLTAIGFVAGILPVLVGMLWFPFFRTLDVTWVHVVLAFSAGILAFIAIEMADEAIGYALEVPTPYLGEAIALLAAAVTVGVMELISRWRRRKTDAARGEGLRVAYLIAIGLGLHSVGEGLAIGSAYVLGDVGLVVLLTLGFIIHNVTEGPAVVGAIARERVTPPIKHFAVLGILAGGGVILGGWIGSFVASPLVAAICFAVAFGAILQVLWELLAMVRGDAERLFERRLVAGFAVGFLLLFFLEEIVVDAWLLY